MLMDKWEAQAGLQLLERERINVMISTPVFMRTMIDHYLQRLDEHESEPPSRVQEIPIE